MAISRASSCGRVSLRPKAGRGRAYASSLLAEGIPGARHLLALGGDDGNELVAVEQGVDVEPGPGAAPLLHTAIGRHRPPFLRDSHTNRAAIAVTLSVE